MVVMSIVTMAQAPQKMNFQALVRNSSNELVTNQQISIEISVLNGLNEAVYTETQSVTTNANGVATLIIGEGTATKGTFAGIDWSAGNYYLQTTANLGGGASAIVGTTPLLSVPYALYAEKAGNADVDLSNYATKDEIPAAVDLSGYAKKEDIKEVDLTGYYSKAEIDALLAALESKIGEGGNNSEEQGNNGNVTFANGAIQAAFSVSATEQIYFSQGNLQYQASTNTWRFAEHQYDIIGADNSNISSSYSGWIDLFGWGTSGFASKNPYMTSTDYSDYGVVGDSYADIAGTNYDWGVYNKISNGGNTAGQWRTLTYGEWYYVMYERSNASSLYGVASVGGVNGMVLLPDDWKLPDGVAFKSGVADNYGSDYYKTVNNYSMSEWAEMESAGAVFLPAAGYRYGALVNNVGSGGYYWSASSSGSSYAYYLYFYSGNASMYGSYRYYGHSVRLVRGL